MRSIFPASVSLRGLSRCALLPAVCLVGLVACSKDEASGTAASASASAKAAPSAAPAASAAPSASASAAPSAAASAAPATPAHDCGKDAPGLGTFAKPCEAKGTARMMTVTWNGKLDEKGPHFGVTNKAKDAILYGKIAVYFYDKAGKQLDTKDASGAAKPFHTCSGNMFSGVMKGGEKAVLTFSCVKKESVPEGTAAIEAEMTMVGFADATEKKNDWYWANPELAPDARKKGGGAAKK